MAQSTTKNNSTRISGMSVAMGFLGTGILTAFAYPHLLPLQTFFSSLFILVGIVAFLIELEKEMGTKNLGIDNSGVGVLVLALSFWLIRVADSLSLEWLRYLINFVLVFLLVLGIAAVFDGIYKILKYVFRNGINFESVAKTFGIAITLVSSVLALLKQAGILVL